VEAEAFFSAYGEYPRGENPGLRVFLARPEYLCAMKLKALQRETVEDRDLEDAVRLGLEIGKETADELSRLFSSFFPDETLAPNAAARLSEVAEQIRSRRRPQ